MRKFECPNCGNTDPQLMGDNGEPEYAPDLELVCLLELDTAEETSFRKSAVPEPNGKFVCGCLWTPNSEE